MTRPGTEPEMEAPSRLRIPGVSRNSLAILGLGVLLGGGGGSALSVLRPLPANAAVMEQLQADVASLKQQRAEDTEQQRRDHATLRRLDHNDAEICEMLSRIAHVPNPCQQASWGPE